MAFTTLSYKVYLNMLKHDVWAAVVVFQYVFLFFYQSSIYFQKYV